MTLARVTHKHVEQACERYNKRCKLTARNAIGRLQWADIRGDGSNRRGLYAIINANGGVTTSNLRRATMRKTIRAIDLAAQAARSQSFALIIRAIWERGEMQRAALDEMQARGLWLSAEQIEQGNLDKLPSGYLRQR